jgi:uncharacterized protein (DUF924 family)
MTKDLQQVLKFWFEESSEDDWFKDAKTRDGEIKERFAELHSRVVAGDFWKERTGASAYLAEVIVLDQFSRQIFRGSGQAFAYDALALSLAQHAIVAGYDQDLPERERMFLYMPFMHSESRSIHAEAVKLFESLGNESSLKYEHIHKDIIDRFGRYPHRNEVLGRQSTPEEIEYLSSTKEDFF